MVDPAHRRRGLGSDLLAAALGEARRRGADQVLLVCPRTASGAAAAFATARGGRFEHAEHALGLYTSLGFVPVITEDYYAI